MLIPSMKRFITLFLILFVSVVKADSYKVDPSLPFSIDKVTLKTGEHYKVPSCRIWMLKDLRKYNEKTWLEIDGKIRIEKANFERGIGKHILEGKLTYRFQPGKVETSLLLYPDTDIVFWSKEGYLTTEVSELAWLFNKGESCIK